MYPQRFTGLGIQTGDEIPEDWAIQLEVDRVQCQRDGGTWDYQRNVCVSQAPAVIVTGTPGIAPGDQAAYDACMAAGGVWNPIRYQCEFPAPEPTTCPEGWYLTEFGSCRPLPDEPEPYEPDPYVPPDDEVEPYVPVPDPYEPEEIIDEPVVVIADPETGDPVVITEAEAIEAEANGEVVTYYGPPASGGGGGYVGTTRVTVQAPGAKTDGAALLRKWLPVGAALLLLFRGGSS